MFQVDLKHPTPLYHQLDRSIRFAIATGRLGIGDQLPTVRQLAVDLRINANTVAKVYAELERTGVVQTQRGVGTFVQDLGTDAFSSSERKRQLAALADDFLTNAAALGYTQNEAVRFIYTRSHQSNQEKSHG